MTTENTTDASSEDVSGLKKNNTDLKRECDSWKQRAEAAEAEALAAKDAADTAAGNQLALLQRKYEKLETALADMTADRDALAGEIKTTRVDHAISAAIASGNVRPEMVDAVEALLHRKVDYTDGEASIAGKSIADFAKTFFAKDGSHYVRAADNSGADAQGNNGSKAVAHSMTKENFDINEFTMIQLENPELANSIAEAVGRPELMKDA